MKKSLILAASLVLAAIVLSACGQTTVNLPDSVSITVPTELPGVTINPTSPPAQSTSQPVVPVTGQNPGGPTTIVFWGVGGLVGLLILIGLIALLTRPSGPVVVEGPPRDREVIERETTVERRDELP